MVVTTALGVDQADETVDQVREALRRAESFGEISEIIVAQLACGTVLLQAEEDAALNEAIDVLHKAHANMREAQGLNHRAAGRRCRPGDRRCPPRAN